MKHRARLSSWFQTDQAILVVFGSHVLAAAVILGWETYITRHGRFFMPVLWPPVYLVAWVTTLLYHHNRSSRRLWRLSGAALLTAYLSRAATLAITANTDGWTAALGFGCLTWLVMAAVVDVLWSRIVTPPSTAGTSDAVPSR